MEVEVVLRFDTPCLGNIRRPDRNLMERDPDGNVIFLPVWWRYALKDAARMLNRHLREVDRIRPALGVKGDLKVYGRAYGAAGENTQEHEAYLAGDTVTCRFMLDGVVESVLRDLLKIVGEYQGMSPFGHKDGYGRFQVVEIRRAGRPD